jgi:CheY-like chemotaxis protein/HPt (histidine-containing phosphotransfer) domain-containing protein
MTESAPDAAAPGTAPASPCILVVDDDPLSRSLLARLLGLLGYRVQDAAEPAAALAAALADDVAALLLDLGMPEVDGFTLLARLRECEAQRGRRPLPAIAVTGFAAAADRARCLMAGFSDHLPKPVEVDALRDALARHLPAPDALPAAPCDAQRVAAAARRLAQARAGDARFAPTLLETFAMRSGQLIEDIARAHGRDDRGAFAHALKALRTSAEFMGATHLAALCDRLRAAAEARDRAYAEALLRSLDAEHQSVLALLLHGARDPARI